MSRLTQRRIVLLLLGLLSAVAVLAGCAKKEREVRVLKLAHVLDTEHPVHKAMVFMAERVREKSAGRMRIDIYPSEQLGSEREIIEQLQVGALAMAKASSSAIEGFVPKMRVFGLPYLFRDSEHCWKVLAGPAGREILVAGEPVGLKGLCFYDAGARSFYTRNRNVETPADLKGLKIRVQKSEMAIKMIVAMGGSATPIDWGELYTSLQQGVVDAAENNPPSFYTSMHYEVCKYYILDEHTRCPDVLMISTFVWEKLSPEFQQILQESADESVTYERKLWDDEEKESLDAVEKAGVIITHPDKTPFREATKSLWEEFKSTEIGEIAERIVEVK